MIYKLRCGMEIKNQIVKEQLDLMNLKVGKSYVVTLGKRVLRIKILKRFGQTIMIKFVWISKMFKGGNKNVKR